MNYALVYIFWRLWRDIREFFHHWYVHAFFVMIHGTLGLLERLDRSFALKITLRHFGQPLFQDRTLVGYILGFFFRSFRILSAFIIYFLVIAAATGVYFAWSLVPLYVIFMIFIF